jgi:hypothetical protein
VQEVIESADDVGISGMNVARVMIPFPVSKAAENYV